MSFDAQQVEHIVSTALALTTPAERDAYLDSTCGTDTALRAWVEALIKARNEAATADAVSTEEIGTAAGGNDGQPVASAAEESTVAESGHEEQAYTIDFLAPPTHAESLGGLAHYDILEVLGQGGFGIVFKAFDAKLHRMVAIKVLSPVLAASSTARRRFIREAQAAAAVRHEHVITIHAVDEQPVPFLVMEYVSGQTLQQKLDRSAPLELREILRIGFQLASGLAAAHKQGLVHRDIKPGNILLENGIEQVKITDFGLARAVDDASITQSGVVAGTPAYMAPEQAMGEALDHRADLFSLGTVLYVMCTGRPPFRASGTMAILKRVCEDTPRPVREINPEIPECLADIITKLHAKPPEERYQSAKEVADLLAKYLAEIQTHGQIVSPVRSLDDSRRAGGENPLMAAPAQAAAPDHVGADARRSRLGRGLVAAGVLLLAAGLAGLLFARTLGWFPVFLVLSNEGILEFQPMDGISAGKVALRRDGKDSDLRMLDLAAHRNILLEAGNYQLEITDTNSPTAAGVLWYPKTVVVSRGQREKIRIEWKSAVAEGAANGVPPPSLRPFVTLGKDAKAEQRHATLLDAVAAAQSGDVIEIRGDGPFVSHPISIKDVALTIRAAEGFRPVLAVDDSGQADGDLLTTDAPLVLEGLEIRHMERGGRYLIRSVGAPLYLASCRLLNRRHMLWGDLSPQVEVRHCEFIGEIGSTYNNSLIVRLPPRGQLLADNNLMITGNCCIVFDGAQADLRDCKVELSRNTLFGQTAMTFGVDTLPDAAAPGSSVKPIKLTAFSNVFHGGKSVLDLWYAPGYVHEEKPLSPSESETFLQRALAWEGRANLYPSGIPSLLTMSIDKGERLKPLPSVKGLTDWKTFWRDESDGIEGLPKYQGGNLPTRVASGTENVQSAHCRLADGSPGKGAGKDGKDLGVDVDLVGPGAAYERWQQTAEYQEWLKRTGQPARGKEITQPRRAVAPFDEKQAKERQAAWAKHLGIDVEIENKIGMKLRLIPPGEFLMGSTEAEIEALTKEARERGLPDWMIEQMQFEAPQRQVVINQPYYLGVHEVTVADFRKFVEAMGFQTDGERSGDGGWADFEGKWVRRAQHVWKTPGAWTPSDREPVVQVSWKDAQAFCRWLSDKEGVQYVLPEEKQWEFAARGGTTQAYGASENKQSLVRFAWTLSTDRARQPQGVGLKEPNAFGLHDMLGNAWEWCAELHPGLGGKSRVLRGGAWHTDPIRVRPAYRGGAEPDKAWDAGVGFRVAITGDLKAKSPRPVVAPFDQK